MDQILSKKQIKAAVGSSDSTIRRMEERGEFPRRLQISPNRVGWRQSEIEQWLAERARGPLPAPGTKKKAATTCKDGFTTEPEAEEEAEPP